MHDRAMPPQAMTQQLKLSMKQQQLNQHVLGKPYRPDQTNNQPLQHNRAQEYRGASFNPQRRSGNQVSLTQSNNN